MKNKNKSTVKLILMKKRGKNSSMCEVIVAIFLKKKKKREYSQNNYENLNENKLVSIRDQK